MIEAVGIGMIEIARMRRVLESRPSFFSRWFADDEMAKAARRARPEEELAGRYACKLAVRSCLRARLDSPARLIDILTANDPRGKPMITLGSGLLERAMEGFGGMVQIEVSITHSRESAAAIAILTAQAGPADPQSRDESRSRSSNDS